MEILLVADIHYSLKQFDWLVQVAPEFDALVIAGDLLDVAGHADLDTQIVVVSQYLERLRGSTPVLVCSGNHDGDMKNDAGEYVAEWLQDVREENLSVDGDTVEVGGLRATVCPWWDGPVTREILSAMLEEARGEASGHWLWIHHAPPDNSPVSWTGKNSRATLTSSNCGTASRPSVFFPATYAIRRSTMGARGSAEVKTLGRSTPAARWARRPRTSS